MESQQFFKANSGFCFDPAAQQAWAGDFVGWIWSQAMHHYKYNPYDLLRYTHGGNWISRF
jgi:plastocyanin